MELVFIPVLKNDISNRQKKIPFRYKDQGALIDNNFKLVATSLSKKEFELYNLKRIRQKRSM